MIPSFLFFHFTLSIFPGLEFLQLDLRASEIVMLMICTAVKIMLSSSSTGSKQRGSCPSVRQNRSTSISRDLRG